MQLSRRLSPSTQSIERLIDGPSSQGCTTRQPGSARSRCGRSRPVVRDQRVLGAGPVVRLGDPASGPARHRRIGRHGRHHRNPRRRERLRGPALARRDAHGGRPAAEQCLAEWLDLHGEELEGAAGFRGGGPDGIGGGSAPRKGGEGIVATCPPGSIRSRESAAAARPGCTAGRLRDMRPGPPIRVRSINSPSWTRPGGKWRARHPSTGHVLVDEDPHAVTAWAAASRIIRSVARSRSRTSAMASGASRPSACTVQIGSPGAIRVPGWGMS